MTRAVRVESITALRSARLAGSFVPHGRRIAFICPCGCGCESYLPLGRSDRPRWEWDGNLDAPTLIPSVFNSGMPCQWHGYLTAGEWRQV